MRREIKPIKFPKDGQAHNNIIEWWYFNGHLKDKKGNKYAFMNCLFKTDVKRVKIPFLSRIPLKTLYFAHSILLDITKQKSYPNIQNIVVVSKDSFTKMLLFINYADLNIINGYINSVIEEIKPFCYRIKTENFDLELESRKKPLLESGKGYINVCGRESYYYSLTNFKVSGNIKIDGKYIKVDGKAWMDHQWADVSYSKDKWSWFSIQLDNNIEIMCCEYDNGKNKDYLADIMYSDGKQESLDKLKLTPGDRIYESKKTKAKYPLFWQIEIPERKIKLKVSMTIKKQEMVFGSINYWEGPFKVNGLFGDKKVKGIGFMELVGYPSNYNNLKYMRDELGKTASQIFSHTKKEAFNAVKNFKTKIAR